MHYEFHLIDFYDYLKGDNIEKLNISKNLVQSLKKYGFVYIKNFGILNKDIDEVFKLSNQFFQLSASFKETMKKETNFCGYTSFGQEKLTPDRIGDFKESLQFNQTFAKWPNKNNYFTNKMLDFHLKCFNLSISFFQSILLGLNVDASLFESKFDGDSAMLKLLRYPPVDCNLNQIRCGEQTDHGAVSFLFLDAVGGFEIRNKDGIWMPMPKINNTVLFCIGDCLEMWSKGILTATPHRNNSQEKDDDRKDMDRYSVVFYLNPNLDCELIPFKEFDAIEFTPKYSSKTYGQFVNEKCSDK
jgi:isopenicillin N synthase-like dioxygenase